MGETPREERQGQEGLELTTAHEDRFVIDNLPPKDLWPVFDFSRIPRGITYPARFNCVSMLLDDAVTEGHGDRPVLIQDDTVWSYAKLQQVTNRLARLLVDDMGLIPGNRVLIRGANTPMMVACWMAVAKAGGVAVATMALLRAPELIKIIDKAEITHALCQAALAEELDKARAERPGLRHIGHYSPLADGGEPGADLDDRLAGKESSFAAVDSAADDPVLIAFTSGTTGEPKGCVHFHRSIMAITDCFPRDIHGDIPASAVFSGSPPLAFTFGLGGLALFPMRFRAAAVLVQRPSPDTLLDAISRHGVTDLFTAPTMYAQLIDRVGDYDISSLQRCNAAGEHLPAEIFQRWKARTGLTIVDQLGATEMLHDFLAAPQPDCRAGSTGRAIGGYEAVVMDDQGRPVTNGNDGLLAVRGPTGCLYLANPEKQAGYVRHGWNYTGDVVRQDAEGYFWYQGRADDMIISAGYNISGLEVENLLLSHPDVAECAVIGTPDPTRGQVVTAYVVARPGARTDDAAIKELQDYVKNSIAPYKYPRRVHFVPSLPRTATGKVRRFELRELSRSGPARAEAMGPEGKEHHP